MKQNSSLRLYLILALAAFTSSAPLGGDISSDKLTFLDKHGYEPVSEVEEILAPVTDNGVNLSDGIISKSPPKMLLYGRFYLLSKKSFAEEQRKRAAEPAQFHRIPQLSLRRNVEPRGIKMTTEATQVHDVIYFPEQEEAEGDAKKYVRKAKSAEIRSDLWPREPSLSKIMVSDAVPAKTGIWNFKSTEASFTSVDNSTSQPSLNTDIEDLDTEEFLSWAKENMGPEKMEYFLQLGANFTSNGETTRGQEQESDIQYNSFILVPGLKCPEGSRLNHRGVCTPKYIHVESPQDGKIVKQLQQSRVRSRLLQILKSLRSLEGQIETSLIAEDQEASTTEENVPDSTIEGQSAG